MPRATCVAAIEAITCVASAAWTATAVMATSIALRFIPITATELERIRAAQRARGARQDGGALEVLAGWRRVLVPLVVALFRRADDLAEAMADRCYTGEQTSMARPLRPVDWVALALGLAWVLAAALL